MSRLHKFAIFLFLVLAVASIWFITFWYYALTKPLLFQSSSQVFEMQRGDTLQGVAFKLHEQGILPYPRLLVWFARLNGDSERLKAGEYGITAGMTPLELLANMVVGRVYLHQIQFIEGWTFPELLQALENEPTLKHTLQGVSTQQVMMKLGSINLHPEGQFFPDTYFFIRGNTDISILKMSYNRMNSVLSKEWDLRDKNVTYKDPYEALIIASLIEKETATPQERPQIAGVILRRLKQGIRLQVDPTVVYGLNKSYGYLLTKADLRSYTPYNTYRYYGLPPTPIDMPSEASIKAALHPDQNQETLFYVSRGDGTHQFSMTYQEHQKAVDKYILKKSTE